MEGQTNMANPDSTYVKDSEMKKKQYSANFIILTFYVQFNLEISVCCYCCNRPHFATCMCQYNKCKIYTLNNKGDIP